MYTHYARGDDRPVIHDQLTRGRTPISLGADDTVHLYVEDPEGEIFIAAQATVVDQAESRVEYEMDGGWPLAGTYEAEWVIEYADGGTRTVPSGSPKEIPVREILDRNADIREYDDVGTLENLRVDNIEVNTAQAVTVGSPLKLGGNNVTGIDRGEANSLGTGEVTIGQTGPVTGIVGDTGEKQLLASTSVLVTENITSTEYSRVTNSANEPRLPLARIFDVTGYKNYYVSFSCDLGNTDGSTTYARLGDYPSTEMTFTGTSSNYGNHSSLAQIDPTNFNNNEPVPYVEIKVDGGTGRWDRPSWFMWGEIA